MVPPDHYITLHYIDRRFICGRMAQAGKAVIDQLEGTKVGASGDDLGAPFSLSALSKSALTHHRPRPAVVLPNGSRAPSGGGSAGVFSLPIYTGRR